VKKVAECEARKAATAAAWAHGHDMSNRGGMRGRGARERGRGRGRGMPEAGSPSAGDWTQNWSHFG
jgi:hypothetical protein